MQDLLTMSILDGALHSESLSECTVRLTKDTFTRLHMKRVMTGTIVQPPARSGTMTMASILNIAM
jgi:hypothetical protein